MRLPLEILARIIEQIDHDYYEHLNALLELRLVSRTVNEEVLRILLRSNELYPRNTEKLLELSRVRISPQILIQHVVRWRKTHDPSEDDTGLPRPRRSSCIMGHPANYRSGRESPNLRPLPEGLMRRYLAARMERAEESPCLLSVFIGRSVDLVMENHNEDSWAVRQQLFDRMVASFNIDLLSLPLAGELFTTLFDADGLYYWLPFYDTLHLTTYPDPEYALRLFLLLRVARLTLHYKDWEDECIHPLECVIDILEHFPAGPEYARLFAIDAYNIIATAKDTDLMDSFHVSNASRALSGLSVAEQIWCYVKQNKRGIAWTLFSRELKRSLPDMAEQHACHLQMVHEARSIVEDMVKNGEDAHFGRSVIEDVLKCRNYESLKAVHQSVRLGLD